MKALQAVVFDWAGTMVDFGSRAPMGAFVEAFAGFGVEISIEEARRPMGLPKLEHIRALGAEPRIAAAWRRARGGPFDEAAARAIYEAFLPLNVTAVADHAALVPGAAELVAALRRQGLRIGSTTGYTREIMAPLLPRAAEQGYAPDNLVCAGDLAAGRPTPLMMHRCFADLGIRRPDLVVKVDDTDPGIAEGLAAGCWAVGVSLSGNGVGLSLEELAAADPAEIDRLNRAARDGLLEAGAHAVVDTVADLLPLLERIDALAAAGAAPRRV
ncbi:MAG: phosphonoacetaldehyde hydrolase [Tistlia sp.]|uniref:phosphonoacetaldehyde hydrolase n=1 Tax=Tistlia sp. TaxID=3057121 RepID=UPI0034A24FAA